MGSWDWEFCLHKHSGGLIDAGGRPHVTALRPLDVTALTTSHPVRLNFPYLGSDFSEGDGQWLKQAAGGTSGLIGRKGITAREASAPDLGL